MSKDLCEIAICDDVQLLINRLRLCTSNILENVIEMAAIVKRLDDLGATVTIKNSMLPYIRLVAHDNLPAECIATLCGDTKLLDQVCSLPRPLQMQVANNEPFKVMELGGDFRMVRPLEMTSRERRQVFDKKSLRSDAEQVGWLREQLQKNQAKQKLLVERPIRMDRQRKGLIVGNIFISLSELAGYVSSLSQR